MLKDLFTCIWLTCKLLAKCFVCAFYGIFVLIFCLIFLPVFIIFLPAIILISLLKD